MLIILKPDYFQLAHFYCRNTYGNYQNLTFVNLEKRQYLLHNRSDNSFKGTVVHRTVPSLHGGSLEISLPVPFSRLQKFLRSIHYTLYNKLNSKIKKMYCYFLSCNLLLE